MGGGDLNMKKSWHPVLLVNQERVWKAEKSKAEEEKKLKQLMKERAEERQLAELQALQEQQTGKKKTDKLDWMYATPASGGGIKGEELEDYLLGKRRVDSILKGDDEKQVKEQNRQAIMIADSARDTAAKIREDPLFAIKQQEQAAYQALMSNPLRLKQLKEKELGKEGRKEEKRREKEERRREKDEKKARKAAGGSGRDRSRSPRRSETGGERERRHHSSSHRERSRSPYGRDDDRHYRSRQHEHEPDYRPRQGEVKREQRSTPPSSYDRPLDRSGPPPSSSSFSRPYGDRPPAGRDDRHHYDGRERDRFDGREAGASSRDPPPHARGGPSFRDGPPHQAYRDGPPSSSSDRYGGPPPPLPNGHGSSSGGWRLDRPSASSLNDSRGPTEDRKPAPPSQADTDRAARLAAMSSNASSMDSDRAARLEQIRERDRVALELETAQRAALAKTGIQADVVKTMQREAIFGEGASLEGRLRDAGKRGGARGFD